MTKYVRLNKTVVGSGDLVPIDKVDNPKKFGEILARSPQSDWYKGLYYYGASGKEYFESNGRSMKGFQGDAYCEKLVFDFDCKPDIDKAKADVQELCKILYKEGVNIKDNVAIFFSGNKGFHVEVFINQTVNPSELKTICSNIAGHLETFDTQIYNTTRLYRIVNTKHRDSGLYKIPLTVKEVHSLSVSEIKEKAQEPRNVSVEVKPFGSSALINKYNKVKNPERTVIIVDNEEDEYGIRGIHNIDFAACPKHKPRCIYALEHGVMKPGERNAAFLRLASYYKNQGMDKDVTYSALKGVARLNASLYPEEDAVNKDELWNTVISSVYSKGWKSYTGGPGTSEEDELLKKYCAIAGKYTDKKCSLHGKNDNAAAVVQIHDVFNSFSTFAENFDKNLVTTGIDLIDDNMKLAIGTTTLLVGASGSGKTTIALNIMENANKMGQYTMFFSLDMHKNLVYLKLAQKVTNYNQEQILQFHKNKDTSKIEEIRNLISERYGKTFFDFSATLTMEQMRDRVRAAEQKSGKKVKLVVVDYASRITGPYSDSYANARYNALKSTEAASDTDAAWIFVSQISRQTGDGKTPLRTKRAAKESGDWEESATNVITVWRPFMGVEGQDDVIRMFLAKNRMGSELERPLWWNGAKGLVSDMNEEDYAQYMEERSQAEKEALKKTFSGGGFNRD